MNDFLLSVFIEKLTMIFFDIGYSEIQSKYLMKIEKLQLLIQEISSADKFALIYRLLFSSETNLLSDCQARLWVFCLKAICLFVSY